MDFKRAGVTDQLETLDFHAFGRVGYINLVLDSGARVKEAMELARHSTPDLTLNTYGRTRDERLQEITEKVGEQVRVKGRRLITATHGSAARSGTKLPHGFASLPCYSFARYERSFALPLLQQAS